MSKQVKLWLVLAFVSTLFSLLVYIVGQQILRTGANDPQIQMAQDIVQELEAGQKPETLIPTTKVDIAQSLAPFVIIYDHEYKTLASSATLDNQTPKVPEGVFEFVKNYGENRVTWQPSSQVRIASVVTKYDGVSEGYVLVGRSLKEVEKREDLITYYVVIVWGLSLLGSGVIILLSPKVFKD